MPLKSILDHSKSFKIIFFFLFRGGEGRGSTTLGQSPKIYAFNFEGVP